MNKKNSWVDRLSGAILGKMCLLSLITVSVTPVRAQTTPIPASFGSPDGAVNLSSPGFLVRVHQMPGGVQRDPMHDIDTVELQLAGQLLDEDGVAYANDADLNDTSYTKDSDGAYIVDSVINFSDATDPFLDTIGSDGNFTPDDKYPGIPGFGNGPDLNDDFAVEVLAFIELKAGVNRLGVNSDDGFRFTIGVGTNTRDAFAIQPAGAVFAGARGSDNTEWDLEVEQDGIYPIRLIHWDGNGGASLEFYSVHPPEGTGERILINDRSNANALKAYRQATGASVTAVSVSPRPDATGAFPRPSIVVQLEDGDAQVDQSSVALSFDGNDVTADTTVRKSGSTTTIQYLAPEFLPPNSIHQSTLRFSDADGVSREHTWSFEIAQFVNLTADMAHPVDAKDSSAPGFVGTVRQARDGAGLAASVARANSQIRDTLVDPFSGGIFENEASTANFTLEGPVNLVESLDDEEQPEKGHFTGPDNPDMLIPGIPGTSDHDNQYAVELVGYLELEAGLYAIGVNSQDGFELAAGVDARDVFDLQVLGKAEGTRAVPADDIMILNVETTGLYSFRLLHFESSDDPIVNFTIPTDGGAVELFTLDPNAYAENPETADRTLVNDPNNADSIKAWQKLTTDAPTYVKAVFPAPGATSVAITTPIEITMENMPSGTPVSMKINGEEVSVRDVRGTIRYQPDELFNRGDTVQVDFTYGEKTHQWNFTTSTGEVAMLITNVGEKESDLLIKSRLEQVFGFDVLLIDDDTVDTRDSEDGKFLIDDAKALDVKMVYVSSPVNSNKAGAQGWHASGIPLINVEQADIDNFQYAPGGGGITQNVTVVEIQLPEHPMAAGLAAGSVAFTDGFLPGSATGSHHAGNDSVVEGDTVSVVATLPGGQAALVGFDKGTTLLDETVLEARMAHLAITGDDQFRSFNESGLKLFDALVAWVLEVKPPSTGPSEFSFKPLTLQEGRITISWEGQATLQEASSVTGPWRDTTNQSNPQTAAAVGTKFFRLVP
jgi:hypothetical protein